MHEFLSDFLTRLEDSRDLERITVPVESGLEIAAITARVSSLPGGGPALLFEQPVGTAIPIVTNLLSSERRLCLALGIQSLAELPARLERLPAAEAGGWWDALKLVTGTGGLAKFQPRVIRTAVCQQVVRLGRDVRLWDLPFPRCWSGETNPVITAAQVWSISPGNGRGLDRFPVQITGPQELVPHWGRHDAAFQGWQRAVQAGRQFPIAISVGGSPVGLLAASDVLSYPADRVAFQGLLQGSGVDLIKARSIDLEVPASAELVLEGYIDTAAPLVCAPAIAGHSGYYQPAELRPVIQVTAITHRSNPVLPVVVAGTGPAEETWIARALERIRVSLIQTQLPEIVDLSLPASGHGRHLLFVSLRKQFPGHARQILHALWGSRLLGLAGTTVVVDHDVNVHDEASVWSAVATAVDPARDLVVVEGPTRDDAPGSGATGLGTKLGLDATRKLPEERGGRAWPDALTVPEDVNQRVTERWAEFGLNSLTGGRTHDHHDR